MGNREEVDRAGADLKPSHQLAHLKQSVLEEAKQLLYREQVETMWLAHIHVKESVVLFCQPRTEFTL